MAAGFKKSFDELFRTHIIRYRFCSSFSLLLGNSWATYILTLSTLECTSLRLYCIGAYISRCLDIPNRIMFTKIHSTVQSSPLTFSIGHFMFVYILSNAWKWTSSWSRLKHKKHSISARMRQSDDNQTMNVWNRSSY